MQGYKPPNHSKWLFNTAPKQCRRRQEVLCPSLSIISFTSKDLQLFFIPFQLFLSMCVFQLCRSEIARNSLSKDWWCERIFPRFLLLGSMLHQTQATTTDLMLQCLKRNMAVDWLAIFNQNLAQDAVRQKNTNKSVSFCHLTCSGCQAFSNGIDCLDVIRDSCSCCFWGVTMGKSHILFTEKKQSCHWFGTRVQCLNFEGCRCRSSACLPPGYNKRPTPVGSLRAKRVDDSFFKTGSAIMIESTLMCVSVRKKSRILPQWPVRYWPQSCRCLKLQLVGFDFYDSSHERFNCWSSFVLFPCEHQDFWRVLTTIWKLTKVSKRIHFARQFFVAF